MGLDREGLPMGDAREVRRQIRNGQWRRPTAGLAPGFVQTNLVILPRDLAFDFLLFAQRNPNRQRQGGGFSAVEPGGDGAGSAGL